VRALDFYQRALQVDPGNPWAYLALARHHAEGLEPSRALAFLDQAEAILEVQDALSPGAEAHLAGLRGAVLQELGHSDEARPYLQRARTLAPSVWSDGRLSADELQ
jgi:tetratricopeptide (TPR) repeat protein